MILIFFQKSNFVPMKNFLILIGLCLAVSCTTSGNKNTEAGNDTGVYFKNIEDGSTLQSPFYLDMGVNGMQVEPKGTPREGYGHHHLLINDDFAPAGTVVVADDTHIHYGGGQTSDSVALEPGEYKLTLQFADGMHVSYGEDWAKTITVTVE